jgi:hypothetical protein
MRDHMLQRRATDSSGNLLHECLELTRRELRETYGGSLIGDELEKLRDGGTVVGDGPGSKPTECRQVLLIPGELWASFGRALACKKTALLKIHPEGARSRGQIRIILRMSRRTHLEIRATDRREGADAATKPPLLQSTRGAQMAPNRDSRVATRVQPACKTTQDRAEQSQRRIPPVHPGEELDEHRSLQHAGAGIGTASDATRRLVNVKSAIESVAIWWADARDDSTLLRAWH